MLDLLESQVPNITNLMVELENSDLSKIIILDGSMLLKSYQEKIKDIFSDFSRMTTEVVIIIKFKEK